MIKKTVSRLVPENSNSLFLVLSESPDKSVICEVINSSELFIFTLSYREPTEDFGELIRYRQELDLAAGRKNNYLGDILIDLTNWIGSEDSEYLDAFLAYLYDYAGSGRYIFAAECNGCAAMENKVSEYFSIKKKQLDLCTGELLRKHIDQYFNKKHYHISSKTLGSLCNLLESYAEKNKITLRGLEVMCDMIIFRSESKTLADTMIIKLIEQEINMRSGGSLVSMFGIGSREERT